MSKRSSEAAESAEGTICEWRVLTSSARRCNRRKSCLHEFSSESIGGGSAMS